jgi:hypothetical protein
MELCRQKCVSRQHSVSQATKKKLGKPGSLAP